MWNGFGAVFARLIIWAQPQRQSVKSKQRRFGLSMFTRLGVIYHTELYIRYKCVFAINCVYIYQHIQCICMFSSFKSYINVFIVSLGRKISVSIS